MRRFTNLLVIAMVAALAAGRAWPTDIETLPEFLERVELEARRLVIRPDGSVAYDQFTYGGTLGTLVEHNLDPLNPSRVTSRGRIPPSAHGWDDKGLVALRSVSEFIPGKGIMLHLTWLRDGVVTRSEDGLMEDFGAITRSGKRGDHRDDEQVRETSHVPADILRTLDAHDTSNVMFGATKID